MGARLKHAAAVIDGTIVQVLFENMNGESVSQLHGLPIQLHELSIPQDSRRTITAISRSWKHKVIRYEKALTSSHMRSQSLYSEEAFKHLTPRNPGLKRYYSGSSSLPSFSNRRLKSLDSRYRSFRLNSPERYCHRNITTSRVCYSGESEKRKPRFDRKHHLHKCENGHDTEETRDKLGEKLGRSQYCSRVRVGF